MAGPVGTPTSRYESARPSRRRRIEKGSAARKSRVTRASGVSATMMSALPTNLPLSKRCIDRGTRFQRQCHRRALGNIGHARALFAIKAAIQLQSALDTEALAFAKILQIDGKTRERPILPLGVHAKRDRRAGGQSRQNKSERRGALVAAARRHRLVADQRMMTCADVHAVAGFGLFRRDARDQQAFITMFAHDQSDA